MPWRNVTVKLACGSRWCTDCVLAEKYKTEPGGYCCGFGVELEQHAPHGLLRCQECLDAEQEGEGDAGQ